MSSTTTASGSLQPSSQSSSSVPDPNCCLYNFEDYEEVLHRTEEVETFYLKFQLLSLQALIDVLVQNMYEYIRLRDTLFWAKICDESDPKTS